MACFEESFNPTPQAVLLNEVFNIGDWMFPNLDKMWGHSGPHVYKIMRDENGRARITFKDWSTDKVRSMVANF